MLKLSLSRTTLTFLVLSLFVSFSSAGMCESSQSYRDCIRDPTKIKNQGLRDCKSLQSYDKKACKKNIKASYLSSQSECAQQCTSTFQSLYDPNAYDPLSLIPCTICDKASGCPSSWLAQSCVAKGAPCQQDGGCSPPNKDISQMCGRCTGQPDYSSTTCNTVNNLYSCLINSNSGGYNYATWTASQACPYGACDQTTCTQNVQEWLDAGENTEVQFNIGSSAVPNYVAAKRGIGHGVQSGERGSISVVKYDDKYALILQVDIRSWSFEFTQATQFYLTNRDPGQIGGTCLVPQVSQISYEEAKLRGAI